MKTFRLIEDIYSITLRSMKTQSAKYLNWKENGFALKLSAFAESTERSVLLHKYDCYCWIWLRTYVT